MTPFDICAGVLQHVPAAAAKVAKEGPVWVPCLGLGAGRQAGGAVRLIPMLARDRPLASGGMQCQGRGRLTHPCGCSRSCARGPAVRCSSPPPPTPHNNSGRPAGCQCCCTRALQPAVVAAARRATPRHYLAHVFADPTHPPPRYSPTTTALPTPHIHHPTRYHPPTHTPEQHRPQLLHPVRLGPRQQPHRVGAAQPAPHLRAAVLEQPAPPRGTPWE